ncbi:MAG: hypothetical protein OEZ36_12565, partial [Spirochaetota bacterium]|nr:hypothetical protein [Spirochaetota bacterium]
MKKLINRFNSLSIRTRFLVSFLTIIIFVAVAVAVILQLGVEDFISNSSVGERLSEKEKDIAYTVRNRLLMAVTVLIAVA